MQKLVLFSIFILFSITSFGQLRRPSNPYDKLDPSEGFITINEINTGFGLAGTESPYSNKFFGFTSLNGYQVNETFMLGGGTGFLIYDDGVLIPVFIDMRLRFLSERFSPYISTAGGLLINPSDFNEGLRMYINPSGGIRYTLRRNIGITASLGLWMQQGSHSSRASFINLKAGAVYKF